MKNKFTRNKIKKSKIILSIIIFLIVITIVIAAYFYYKEYSDKILPNTFINGENYSNLTEEEAKNKLENKIKDFRENGIDFVYENKTYNAQLKEMGIDINTEKIISDAFGHGHKNSIFEDLKDWVNLWTNNVNILIIPEINKEKLENYILENLSEIEDQPKNFGYKYENGEFVSVLAESGIIIDRNKLIKNISENIFNLNNKIINIELVKKNPEINEDKNENALFYARNLFLKKIILKYNSSIWEVQKDDFAIWIQFNAINSLNNDNNKVLGINADKDEIKDYLLTLIPQINREPVNAQLEFKKGKIDLFSLSQEGIALQVEKSINEIEKVIFNTDNYQDNSEIEIEIQMIMNKVQPEITTESIDNMGITALLATGES
ncbi:MAG: peptidoglycan binding domain-containing protein, partial [Candidatus Pacebacteria bacterium]|nr:peptidoglycan binding domain-containing protein [Candidatus Paceibacterota bacterium]